METTAAMIKPALKEPANCKAVTVGNIIKLDTSIVPATRIPNTTVAEAVKINTIFTNLVFKPLTFAYSLSNVMENKS